MKRSTARRTLAVAAATAVSLTLAACGSSPGGPSAGGTTAWGLSGGSQAAFEGSFNRWNEANPDRTILVEWFANDAFKEKIRTAVGAGNAPTLIYSWTGGTLQDYVNSGDVVDMTQGVADLTARVIPSVAENGVIDGKVYAVPNTQTQPVVLYFNKELLDKAGVNAPTTWSELLTAVEALKGIGVAPFALAGQSVWPELMWIEYLTDRAGGPEVFQRILDGEANAWSDPAVLDAATKIQELVEAGAFGKNYGSVSADAGADVALVHTGRAAMLLQGSWVYPTFQNDAPDFVDSGKLGYSNFPALEDGTGDPAAIVGNPSNFWSVSADAAEKSQQTAVDYLNASLFTDAHIDELLSIGTVPPVAGLEDKIAATDNADYLSFVYGIVRDAPSFELSWDQALPAAQAQALLNNLSQLFLKQITPQQFADNLNATLGS